MRFPRRQARAPVGFFQGTFTLRRVPAGIGTRSISSTSRATNAAASVKSYRRPALKSISPPIACWEMAIAGMPSTTPSNAAATVPE